MNEKKLTTPPIPIQTFAMFADESDITNARHSLVGGTVVKSDRLEFVYNEIWKFRQEYKMFAELKWSKISNQKQDAYSAFIDLYFNLMGRGYLTFHATSFDNHEWKHQIYNDSDPDVGLSKNYYQMILHQFAGTYGDLATLFVCLDRRHSSTRLGDLQRMLNAGAAKDYGLSFGPIRFLTSRDSKKDDMLQINDVILGGISSFKNERHLSDDIRSSKRELARKIVELSGLKTLHEDSPYKNRQFTFWNRQPR